MSKVRMIVSVPDGNGYSDPSTVHRITQHFDELGCKAKFATRNGESASIASYILRSHYGLSVMIE